MKIDLDKLFASAKKKPKFTSLLRGVDLFAGVGGFTMASVDQGCWFLGIERDPIASQTAIRHGHPWLTADVGKVSDHDFTFPVDLLVGGPPCQPFSSMGAGKGEYDPRDGFPIALRTIDVLRPRRVVFENVPSFVQKKHLPYAKKVLADLGKFFAYTGVWQLNAKDFGVPQDRKRVFIWGAEEPLEPPVPTHGPLRRKPYVSVRQSLPHLALEAPAVHVRSITAVSRSIDEPSPTVATKGTLFTAKKAGLVYRKGEKHEGRRLVPDELKVLQGFPSAFTFSGNITEQHRQIGNAVPPPLGKAVIEAVSRGLEAVRLEPEEVLQRLRGDNPKALLIEPREVFDGALVGVSNVAPWAKRNLVAVYDRLRLIELAAEHAQEADPSLDDEEAWGEAGMWVDSIDYPSNPNSPMILNVPLDDPQDW
jgi:DNA (cytosine-5)-methyltransferase 1